MSLEERLEGTFDAFLENRISEAQLIEIRDSVTITDVEALMRKIASLDDPSAYCRDDEDSEIIAGFFLFIDFVSALIIRIGPEALPVVEEFRRVKRPFVPWVVKCVEDARFHDEILSRFDGVFEG